MVLRGGDATRARLPAAHILAVPVAAPAAPSGAVTQLVAVTQLAREATHTGGA